MPNEEEYVFSNPVLKEIDSSMLRIIGKMEEMIRKMDENIRESREDRRLIKEMFQKPLEASVEVEKTFEEHEKSDEILPSNQEPEVKQEVETFTPEIFFNMIDEFLTKIQNLLKGILFKNNENFENTPMEEEKTEPRRLGFF